VIRLAVNKPQCCFCNALTLVAQAVRMYPTYLESEASTRNLIVSSIVKRTRASKRRNLLNLYVSMLLSWILYLG